MHGAPVSVWRNTVQYDTRVDERGAAIFDHSATWCNMVHHPQVPENFHCFGH
jgi:hypothetical protein